MYAEAASGLVQPEARELQSMHRVYHLVVSAATVLFISWLQEQPPAWPVFKDPLSFEVQFQSHLKLASVLMEKKIVLVNFERIFSGKFVIYFCLILQHLYAE